VRRFSRRRKPQHADARLGRFRDFFADAGQKYIFVADVMNMSCGCSTVRPAPWCRASATRDGAAQSDLVETVHTLRQIVCVKG